MIGEDFRFGSTWLSDFDMKMYDPSNEQAFPEIAIEKSDMSSQLSKPNHFGVYYSDVLTLEFFILKSYELFNTQDEFLLTGDDINTLRAWLESPKVPTELYVTNNEIEESTYYYGIFTNISPFVVSGNCYGLHLVFTCDSPYGYSEEKTVTHTFGVSEYTATLVFNNLSSEKNEYLKPTITVISRSTFGSGETLSITNQSDNRNVMSINIPEGIETLIIDCDRKIVKDGDGNLIPANEIGLTTPVSSEYNFISADSFLFYWLSLVYGENQLNVELSVTNTVDEIEISGKYIMKTGGF